MSKDFFNNVTSFGMGVKGLGDGVHLSHTPGSDDFHVTTPVNIPGLGTVKVRDFFDTEGNFNSSGFGFTNKE